MKVLPQWLNKLFFVDQVFQFRGTIDDLNARIREMKDDKWSKELLYSDYIDVNHYQIRETTLGTYIGFPGNGGVLDLKIKRHDDEHQTLYFSSTFKWYTIGKGVILFIALAAFAIYLITDGQKAGFVVLLATILVAPLLVWVNNSHYLRADQRLLDKVARRLRLRSTTPSTSLRHRRVGV